LKLAKPGGCIAVDALTLQLHLVLDDEGLALVLDLLGELGGDGVVSGGVLNHQALITLDALEDMGLLYGPLSNVGPLLVLLVGAGGVLLSGGRLPAGIPAIGELLKEVGLDGGGLAVC
jgi:hypothetical protein